MQALPRGQDCCSECGAPSNVSTPGAAGSAGASGQVGLDGSSAFTFTTAPFIMPGSLGSVVVQMLDAEWISLGQKVFVVAAGTFLVTGLPAGGTSAILKNLRSGLFYDDNAPDGILIASAAKISPSGAQGPAGMAVQFADQEPGTFFSGPIDGVNAPPAFRKIDVVDLLTSLLGGTPVYNRTTGAYILVYATGDDAGNGPRMLNLGDEISVI